MADVYSFPLLKGIEIIECLNDLGIPFSSEEVFFFFSFFFLRGKKRCEGFVLGRLHLQRPLSGSDKALAPNSGGEKG